MDLYVPLKSDHKLNRRQVGIASQEGVGQMGSCKAVQPVGLHIRRGEMSECAGRRTETLWNRIAIPVEKAGVG